MNRILSTSVIGTVAALALVAGSCAPAFAAETTKHAPSAGKSLTSVQAKAKLTTTARIHELHAAIAKIDAAKEISSADRSSILGTLNRDVAGMNSVEIKIAADTTLKSAAADYKTIDSTYRIREVAIPQSRLAAAADRMTARSIPKLTAAQTKLAAALAGRDSAKSTPELRAALADMSTRIEAAKTELSGIAARALSVTPAEYNSNHAVLSPIRSAVKTAITDLKHAAADRKTISAAIK